MEIVVNAFPSLLGKIAPPHAAGPYVPDTSVVVDIHRLQREDLPALYVLRQQQRDEVSLHADAVADADALELQEVLFDLPRRCWAWIARDHDEPVGYALATVGYAVLEGGYYLRLETLHVHHAWRRRGIESQLLEAARRTSSELGCLSLQWSDGAHLPRLSADGAIHRHAAAHLLPSAASR